MSMANLVDYRRATSAHDSMKLPAGTLYSYIWAANGTFVYSENEHFRVLMPLRWWKMEDERKTVRGLAVLEPYFHLNSPFVSYHILNWILESSRRVVPDEMLFFIRRNPGCMWYAAIPVQKFGSTFCQAIEPGDYCPIELHSHNVMPAFFSNTDNKEETGLRIYAVLGKVTNSVAEIRVRVSVYGHYWTIPYEWVFEPCDEVKNV